MRKRIISGFLTCVMMVTVLLSGCTASNDDPGTTLATSTVETTGVTENTTAPTESTPVEIPTDPIPEVPETTVATEPVDDEQEDELTPTQRNSINMLNYITVLTQEINESKSSRMYLSSVQSSLLNNLYLNAVNGRTQTQINKLWRTIDEYKMIEVKRDRLEFIYEQNQAQALREAIPNPLGLMSTIQSGNLLKTAISVLYMAVDAKASYDAASTRAELDYLQKGWELEDEETQNLSDSQLNLLNYMLEMARDNDIPGEYALKPNEVADFVAWVNKDSVTRKIEWLEAHEETYREFRTYWLKLAECYFEAEDYVSCLNSIESFERVATRIFDQDLDYARAIPMAIYSAKAIMDVEDYVEYAKEYVQILLDNCGDEEWALRYFAAQIYIDLYAIQKNNDVDHNGIDYLKEAYRIVKNNVNVLAEEQKKLNDAYLAPIEKVEAKKNASKREKEEVKEYNDLLADKRATELPPVNEAFYLNCELLFALIEHYAEQLELSQEELKDIDDIVHEEGRLIFLTEALDNRFWANRDVPALDSDNVEITFDGKKLVIPANCVTERFNVRVEISDGTVLDDWEVVEVKRPKGSTNCAEYLVTLTNEAGIQHNYSAGETIIIKVIPVSDAPEAYMCFTYEVVAAKVLYVFDGIEIERVLNG